MKLTDFLISRQHGLSKNIAVDNEAVYFKDINTILKIKGWNSINNPKFRDFISKYTFPKNEEFSKKDRDGIRTYIPEPQVLIQKDNGPVVAMYLYEKSQLTGDSTLHIRSINKLEQMWLPYFFSFNTTKRDNPKLQKRDFYEFCQSTDINFHYTLTGNTATNESRLRVLSFAFKEFVLLMYVFDNNNFTQEELMTFVDNLKSST